MTQKSDVVGYLLRRPTCSRKFDADSSVVTSSSEFLSFIERIKDAGLTEVHRGIRLVMPFDLWFPELFLVNDPLQSHLMGFDHCSIADAEGNPWLPPSSIRGVLRSRSEQILRTLNPKSACDPSCDQGPTPRLSCSKRIEILKKSMPDGGEWPGYEEVTAPGFLCLACKLFGSTAHSGRLRFQAGEYQPEPEHKELLHHFLAVCRFTGGGKDGAKFDAFPLYNVTFANCRVLIEDFELWQIGLLALVFKDLLQDDTRMGFGTRKGFGQVVGSINFNGNILLSTPSLVCSCKVGELLSMPDNVKCFVDILERAVDHFREMTRAFEGMHCETVGESKSFSEVS
jgi:CRISPR/Cas system CSM-associated protein Csm3 (group 7 of RAMP superfamily)